MINNIFYTCLFISIFTSCSTSNSTSSNRTEELSRINQPQIYPIKSPVTGNYPQGLYKYPYKVKSLADEQFTQTLVWSPAVSKTFAADTSYTAIMTLSPVDKKHTFEGIDFASVGGLPQDGVKIFENKGKDLVIKIEFEKTASVKAVSQIIFSDEFDGASLNTDKWDLCPEWDRQGRSSWRDDMVSVSGGFLHLKFKPDPQLGASKSNNKTLADNWIRAGAIRTSKKNRSILFDNTYGYYEARIKFPVVSGTWGAFWLMSPTQHFTGDEGKDGTEIDIVESIHNQRGEYNAALHWNGYENNHKSVGSSERPVNIYDGEFHVFALDWSPLEYIFYVDGVEFWRVDGGARFQNAGINQNPNYIKLTVESAPWAGDIPSNFTEGEMLVDYVRVYNQPQN